MAYKLKEAPRETAMNIRHCFFFGSCHEYQPESLRDSYTLVQEKSFYYHAWAEVLLQDTWVPDRSYVWTISSRCNAYKSGRRRSGQADFYHGIIGKHFTQTHRCTVRNHDSIGKHMKNNAVSFKQLHPLDCMFARSLWFFGSKRSWKDNNHSNARRCSRPHFRPCLHQWN